MLLISIFLSFSHPLILITQTIILTILVSWFITQIFSSSWVRFILILIFLGALLTIFVYLSSIVPNEVIKLNFKFLYVLIVLLLLNNISHVLNTDISFIKKIIVFSHLNFNLIIPFIIFYIIIGLTVRVYITSIIKNPIKQEIN